MAQRPLEKREAEFLIACGVDTSNGFWSEDIEHWKAQEPDLYREYVTLG